MADLAMLLCVAKVENIINKQEIDRDFYLFLSVETERFNVREHKEKIKKLRKKSNIKFN